MKNIATHIVLWFKAYTVSLSTTFFQDMVSKWTESWVSHSTVLLGHMLLGDKVCDMTSKFHGLESVAVLLLLWSEFLNRNSVVQNIIRMDKALYESTDDGARRSIIDREGQSISKLCVYPNKNMSVSFHEGSGPIWPTYHQVAGLFLQGRVPNRRPSVSLCSQLFRHSAIAEQQAPLQTTWLFCTWVHLESTRMEVDGHQESVILSTWLLKDSSSDDAF